jgi:hypothetical protein
MTHDLYPSQLALSMLLWRQLHSLLPLFTLLQCSLALTFLACPALWNSVSCFCLLSTILVRSTKVENLPALALALPAKQDRLDFGHLGDVSTILFWRRFESSPPDSSRTASIGLSLLLSIKVLRVSLTSKSLSNAGYGALFLRLHLSEQLKESLITPIWVTLLCALAMARFLSCWSVKRHMDLR